ncbi:MAG: hypothetical protein NTW87_29435 [Planctomycetota bacterium]|nr:hypothetical protein [Planctomycetota bacterium]
MNIDLSPALEQRLAEIARQRSVPAARIVEEIVARFVESIPDDPAAWVKATVQRLPNVWPAEDFSAWAPPRGT